MEKRKPLTLTEEIKTSDYGFLIETKITYFDGDGLKDVTMPGWFMQQSVYLMDVPQKQKNLISQMERELPLLLTKIHNREITNEPLGYEKLVHKDLIRNVKQKPDKYMTPSRLIELLKH